MKKLFFFDILSVLVFIGLFSSCGTEEFLDNEQSENLKIEEQYEGACKRWATINSEELENISNYQSRNTPDNIIPAEDLVGFLMSVSDERFEVLYREYVDVKQMCQRAEVKELKIDTLIDITSATEVQELYNYIKDYISIGGHSVNYIEQYARSIKTPVIRYLAINSSAYYAMISTILFWSGLVLVASGMFIMYKLNKSSIPKDSKKYKTIRIVAYAVSFIGLACDIINLFI